MTAVNPTVSITRRIEWDAAHRVLRHESKCATLHGHRYVALVRCSAEQLDAVGRVVDFSVIKDRVGGWVDEYWDHTTLVNSEDAELVAFCTEQACSHNHKPAFLFTGEPTAENIATYLHGVAAVLLSETGVKVVSVEVFETPNCSATARDETFSVRQEMPRGTP